MKQHDRSSQRQQRGSSQKEHAFRRGGRREREKSAPKPYASIPLPATVDRLMPCGHDKLQREHLVGTLKGRIVALSSIHISSGSIELTENIFKGQASDGELRLAPHLSGGNELQSTPLVISIVRSKGEVVIPGSSLKGVLRCVVEAITPSCLSKTGAKKSEIPPGLNECRDKTRLCIACRIFGAMGYQGNLFFTDAKQTSGGTVIEKIPPLYSPETRRREYYDENRQVKGRKFYLHGQQARGETPIEVCPPDSTFEFALHFSNLKPSEFGLVLIALGQHPMYPFKLKIGGAKPVCRGTIDIIFDALFLINDLNTRYLSYEAENGQNQFTDKELWNFFTSTMELALREKFMLPAQLTEIAEALKYPDDRKCPAGNY
ncbi:hypothetical protein FJZ31_28520 [Candidatus Poribacteria bacterium]|nr:hypothetical protein [Candidatus Poribacteria bacterium]